MSESRNVQLLREYHGALQDSDGEKMASMLAPDLRYWISPGSAFSGTHTKESVLALLPAIFDAQAGPSVFRFRDDKIVEILEYLDILEVWKTFGTPDQKAMAEAAEA